jgi:hypothetical protein
MRDNAEMRMALFALEYAVKQDDALKAHKALVEFTKHPYLADAGKYYVKRFDEALPIALGILSRNEITTGPIEKLIEVMRGEGMRTPPKRRLTNKVFIHPPGHDREAEIRIPASSYTQTLQYKRVLSFAGL